MQETEDPNIRKIVVGKDCYAKYCSKCPYCIKAYWEKKQGFKYGWIGVECCVNGGACMDENTRNICPEGIGYKVCLGQSEEFDPEMMWKPSPPIVVEGLISVEVPKRKDWWSEE